MAWKKLVHSVVGLISVHAEAITDLSDPLTFAVFIVFLDEYSTNHDMAGFPCIID